MVGLNLRNRGKQARLRLLRILPSRRKVDNHQQMRLRRSGIAYERLKLAGRHHLQSHLLLLEATIPEFSMPILPKRMVMAIPPLPQTNSSWLKHRRARRLAIQEATHNPKLAITTFLGPHLVEDYLLLPRAKRLASTELIHLILYCQLRERERLVLHKSQG